MGEKIAILIGGGVVLAASDNTIPTGEVTDGTQECREVHYDDRPGEGIRDHVINNDDKPIDSIDLLELVIEDPSAVGSGDDLLYYIRKMSNGKYAVVKVWKEFSRFPDFFFKLLPDAVNYWATTTLTNTDDNWFDTLEDAKDAAEDNAELDWNDNPGGC